jgi:hypothetical protein
MVVQDRMKIVGRKEKKRERLKITWRYVLDE